MTALDTLRAAGFAVRLIDGGRIGLTPADRLDDGTRAWIGERRGEIVGALQTEVANERCHSAAAGTEPVVRGKLDAYAALLERDGYGGHSTRLPARLRRDLAQAAGGTSLRAMRDDTEAWQRASTVVDEWIARLAADARRGPPA